MKSGGQETGERGTLPDGKKDRLMFGKQTIVNQETLF